MTTTTSSPDRFGSFLRGLLRKNRSAMIYLFALSFICMPLQYAAVMFRRTMENGLRVFASQTTLGGGLYVASSAVMMVIIWITATLVIGISGTNYMQNKRAVDLYHSLPLTRRQLLLANFTASFVTVTLPLTVNYLINGVLAAIRHAISPTRILFSLPAALLDLLGWYAAVFAILAVIMLMATQVGSTFDTFLFSGVFLAAPPVLHIIHTLVCQSLLRGYCYYMRGDVICCLSPVSMMAGRYACDAATASRLFNGAIAVWLVLGTLLLFAAMRLYVRRPSERAESPARVGIAALLFRMLSVFVGGVGLGCAFTQIIGVELRNHTVLLLSVAAFSLLVFFLVEAVLNRGFKGIQRRSYLSGGVLVLLAVLYIGVLSTGGLGFESRIPSTESVASVEISYRGRFEYVTHYNASSAHLVEESPRDDGSILPTYAYNPIDTVKLTQNDSIALVSALQSEILSQECAASDGTSTDTSGVPGGSIDITYCLKNGRQIKRSYECLYSKNVRLALIALENNPEFRAATSPIISWTAEQNDVDSITVGGSHGMSSTRVEDDARIVELMEALQKDVNAESAEDYYAPGRETAAYLYVDSRWTEKWDETAAPHDFWSSYTIPVSDGYQNTLALLDKWGIDYKADESSYDGGRLYIWGWEMLPSGLITFPAWTGEASDIPEGYNFQTVTREQAAKLIALSTEVHSNNGKDDSLYLCLIKGDSLGVPMFLSPEAADSLGDPYISQFVNEYYNSKGGMQSSMPGTALVPADAQPIKVG